MRFSSFMIQYANGFRYLGDAAVVCSMFVVAPNCVWGSSFLSGPFVKYFWCSNLARRSISWLVCFNCGVAICGASSWCHGLVCSL